MIDLKVKDTELAACGPYPASRSKVLVFTQGNDFEWHGPALPADVDSRVTISIALRFIERTGARLAAHVPFTSDRVGEIAKDWCPAYIPYDEFKQKLKDCMGAVVRSWPDEVTRVLLLLGHGGVWTLVGESAELSEAVGVETRAVFVPGLAGKEVELPDDFEGTDTLRRIISGKGEHAYIMEHSIAAHLGCLDRDKLGELNRLAAKDPEAALRRWPPIAGLGGYVKYGGERYEPLRKVIGEFCADDFIRRRNLPVSAEAGKALVDAQLAALEKLAFAGLE